MYILFFCNRELIDMLSMVRQGITLECFSCCHRPTYSELAYILTY